MMNFTYSIPDVGVFLVASVGLAAFVLWCMLGETVVKMIKDRMEDDEESEEEI